MPKTMQIKVEDYVPEFVQLAKKGKNALLMSHVYGAVEKLATQYQMMWTSAAGGAALAGLPFLVNGTKYPLSIQRRQIAPGTWEVYSDYTTKTGLGVTDLLEKGHGNIDLKPGLLNGPKSKTGKNGRYNIVPYQHGSSGSDPFRNNPMMTSVYKSIKTDSMRVDAAKKAGATDISGGSSYTSKSSSQIGGSAATVWGSKFDPKSMLGARIKTIKQKGKRIGDYAWKYGKYAGMYRLQEDTQRQLRGGYMTFRVVSSASDPMSWIVPEQEPWPIRTTVISLMAPLAEAALAKAMEADFK